MLPEFLKFVVRKFCKFPQILYIRENDKFMEIFVAIILFIFVVFLMKTQDFTERKRPPEDNQFGISNTRKRELIRKGRKASSRCERPRGMPWLSGNRRRCRNKYFWE